MTERWRDLVRRATSAFSPRRIVLGVMLILVSHRRDLSLLPQMALAIEHRHVHRNAFNSVSLLIGHRPKAQTLSEKLNQLRDDLKTEDEMILRKLHAKHRNGQDS
jgi:hypothetical protein